MSLEAQRWESEYQSRGIPSSFRTEPSGALVDFVNFAKEFGRASGQAVDLGAGTGRNSLWLASQGYAVHSIEFVPRLVEDLRDMGL